MVLRAGYLAVAQKLQEAAAKMSHSDIQTRLSDDLNDQNRGTGHWCYLVAVFGDDKSGECVYSCDGDLMKAPYTCDKSGAKVDMTKAVDVVPLTTYEVEPAEPGLLEAGRRNSSRDQKQLQAIHDGAKSLGADCGMKESAVGTDAGLALVESAATTELIVLREARADYEIKLIAPGKGSSAFYPAEVLKRDGPNVFKAGTHVYLNHPTAAEESQRPEGDVANLAGVLTSTAVYHEAHDKGPGLYGRMKVFADHAQMVEEKAAHVGMSIRARGVAEAGKTRDGVPVLKELTGAESVDVVTRAGAGGMILTEAAKPANPNTGGATEMDAAEVTKLVEAAVKAALAPVQAQQTPLIERAIRGDAREAATKILSTVTLHEAAKGLVIDSVLRDIPQKDGGLDTDKFTESVNAEAKRIGEVMAAAGTGARPVGMGGAPVQIDAKEAERRAAEAKTSEENAIKVFESLGMPKDAAAFAAKGRAA